MIDKIKSLIDKESYEEALKLVNAELEKSREDLDFLYLKADILKKLQRTSDAVNIYIKILEIYPNEKKAEIERDLIRMVMLQENKDFFECTNLYDDPWL